MLRKRNSSRRCLRSNDIVRGQRVARPALVSRNFNYRAKIMRTFVS